MFIVAAANRKFDERDVVVAGYVIRKFGDDCYWESRAAANAAARYVAKQTGVMTTVVPFDA